VTRTHTDDATNRRLLLLVGLVVVCASLPLTWSINRVIDSHHNPGWYPI